MKRISKLLNTADYEYEPKYPDDFLEIRERVPQIAHLSHDTLKYLWNKFSEHKGIQWLDFYTGTWKCRATPEQFREWLFEEMD